jgi:hypothetical protein
MGRHQQHRQLRLARTQQTEQLVSVHARHIDVTDHQIYGMAPQHRERFAAVRREVTRLQIEPRNSEDAPDYRLHGGAVIND